MGIKLKIIIILILCTGKVYSCENYIFNKIAEGDIVSVKRYLSNGGNPNLARIEDVNNCVYETRKCSADTLISMALLSGEIDIAIELVKFGADFNNNSRSLISPIEIAIELDQLKFIKYLLDEKLVQINDYINDEKFLDIATSLGGKKISAYVKSLIP